MRKCLVGIFVCFVAIAVVARADDSSDTNSGAVIYKALAPLATAQRKILFSQLTSEGKAAVWRYQIEEHLRLDQALSDEQQAVLRQALSLLDATLFDADSRSDDWPGTGDAPVRALMDKVAVSFSHDVAHALFGQLGGPQAPEERVPPAPWPDCECSHQSDWCWGGTFCGNPPYSCKLLGSGCGTFFLYNCDGMCISTP